MEYKVLQYFQWGQLKLEEEQILIIEKLDDRDAIVSIKHYPEKTQRIAVKAIDSMISLQKIEKY